MTGVELDHEPLYSAMNSKSARVTVNDSFRHYLSEIYRLHNLEFKCRFPGIIAHVPWIAQSGQCTSGSLSLYQSMFIDTSTALLPLPPPPSPPPPSPPPPSPLSPPPPSLPNTTFPLPPSHSPCQPQAITAIMIVTLLFVWCMSLVCL